MAAGPFVAVLLLAVAGEILSYQFSSDKDPNYLTDTFLREMAHHITRDLAAVAADGYGMQDVPDSSDRYVDPRVMKALEGEDSGSTGELQLEGLSPPSLRDREFLQHSSLWSSQLVAADPSDPAKDLAQVQMKQPDPSLPAYCNPPNPCPVGYSGEDGCLEEFENTAAFSRKYQAMQECMCDTEHMFDCPIGDDYDSVVPEDIFMDQFGLPEQHKSLVAKKFHTKKSSNPYLQGEKLPIAAKKGNKLG